MHCRSSSRTNEAIAWVVVQLVAATALMPLTARAADEAEEPEVELAVLPPPSVDPHRHWQPHWERFDAAGAVLIATAEGTAFAVYLAEPVLEPRWVDRLPGDEDFRRALRLDAPDYAAAGLVCVHHIENPWLSGSTAGAAATCAGGLSIATAVSILRLNADRHWASDQWIGSLMGAAIGFGLPYALSYGRARLPREARRLSVRPGSDGGPLGLTVGGVF